MRPCPAPSGVARRALAPVVLRTHDSDGPYRAIVSGLAPCQPGPHNTEHMKPGLVHGCQVRQASSKPCQRPLPSAQPSLILCARNPRRRGPKSEREAPTATSPGQTSQLPVVWLH